MPAGTLTFDAVPTAAPTDDRDAIARVLDGDGAAWDELFRRYNRRVVLALLATGVPPSAARDLAQDAWIKIIERQRAGKLASLSLPALVIAQAVFLARDAARRKGAAAPHVELSDADVGVDVDVEQTLIDRDRLARARVALTQCGRSHQRVFRAIYAHPGASAAEVAARTGLSVQRVRQIVCEVRKKLRAAVAAEVTS